MKRRRRLAWTSGVLRKARQNPAPAPTSAPSRTRRCLGEAPRLTARRARRCGRGAARARGEHAPPPPPHATKSNAPDSTHNCAASARGAAADRSRPARSRPGGSDANPGGAAAAGGVAPRLRVSWAASAAENTKPGFGIGGVSGPATTGHVQQGKDRRARRARNRGTRAKRGRRGRRCESRAGVVLREERERRQTQSNATRTTHEPRHS